MPGIKGRRGFGSAQQQFEKNTARMGSGKFIRNLYLKGDGDMARFAVVTSMGQWGAEDDQVDKYAAEHGATHEVLNGEFHRYPMWSPKGKQFYVSRLCCAEEDEEGNLSGECAKCDEDPPIGRSTQFMAWVFLYAIYHRNQEDASWQGCTVGNVNYYREDVNSFVLWQDGFYMSRRVQDRLATYGTFMDRDWVLKRYGAKGSGNVTYDLVNSKEHEPDADMIEQANNLPDLEDVANGVTETLDGAASTKGNESGSAPGGPPPETDLEEDDSFGGAAAGDGDEINFDDLPW